MIQNAFSILLDVAILVFLLATFYWGYDFLIATRLLMVAFMVVYLIAELRKKHISISKPAFTTVSVLFLLMLTGTIVFDHYWFPSSASSRDFLIPVSALVLLKLLQQDLRTENRKSE